MSTREDPPVPQPADDETVSYSQARRTTSDPSAESRPSSGDPGRYKLGPLLGQGGMATVLEAEDTRLDRTVAVKCMKPSIAGDPDLRRRFFAEAKILAALAHPGTVPVFDLGEDDEPYYAMERVQGETLTELLRKRTLEEIRDPSSLLHHVDTFERVCQTMGYVHSRGVIHRDLKPGNIMADRFGAVFVMDWGIAKRLTTEEHPFVDEDATRHGAVLGTPGYMAPEQIDAESDTIDARADVFSLGIILYQILTGERPFKARNPPAMREEIRRSDPRPPIDVNRTAGRELSAICMKALEKDPDRRYASAEELARDIRCYRESLPVSAIRPRPVDRLVYWARRHRALAAASATLVLIALLLGAVVGSRAYLQNRMLNSGLSNLEQAREELADLSTRLEEMRVAAGSLPEGSAERRRAELDLAEQRGRLGIAQFQFRGRVFGIAGFTFPDVHPRVRELGRWQTFNLLRTLQEEGNHAMADALASSTLEQIETGNFFGYTDEHVEQLHDAVAMAESAMGR